MNFSLIICTYMRDKPLLKLLNSVKRQTRYPNEILIIDSNNVISSGWVKKEKIAKIIKKELELRPYRLVKTTFLNENQKKKRKEGIKNGKKQR